MGSKRCQKTIKLPHKAVRGVKAESQEHGWTLVSRIQHGGLQTWFPAAGQLVLHLLIITELRKSYLSSLLGLVFVLTQ